MSALDPDSHSLNVFQAITCLCAVLYGLIISYQVIYRT